MVRKIKKLMWLKVRGELAKRNARRPSRSPTAVPTLDHQPKVHDGWGRLQDPERGNLQFGFRKLGLAPPRMSPSDHERYGARIKVNSTDMAVLGLNESVSAIDRRKLGLTVPMPQRNLYEVRLPSAAVHVYAPPPPLTPQQRDKLGLSLTVSTDDINTLGLSYPENASGAAMDDGPPPPLPAWDRRRQQPVGTKEIKALGLSKDERAITSADVLHYGLRPPSSKWMLPGTKGRSATPLDVKHYGLKVPAISTTDIKKYGFHVPHTNLGKQFFKLAPSAPATTFQVVGIVAPPETPTAATTTLTPTTMPTTPRPRVVVLEPLSPSAEKKLLDMATADGSKSQSQVGGEA
jgi:hypothetical protein